jgi:hypothetical protein
MWKWILLLLFGLLAIGPVWLLVSNQVHLGQDFETADRSSAEIAPSPRAHPAALIQLYSARAFNWRGLFSTHTWIAVKPKNAAHYQVLQVIGWRMYHHMGVVDIGRDVPDRIWFGNRPIVLAQVSGDLAEKLIPKILSAAKEYPYPKSYRLWPGPNSNTFTAFIARRFPELRFTLPGTAIGKDYLVDERFFAKAPSGTGYQFSLFGLLSGLLAQREGLEINVLGLVFGINPLKPFIDWPFIGKIGR